MSKVLTLVCRLICSRVDSTGGHFCRDRPESVILFHPHPTPKAVPISMFRKRNSVLIFGTGTERIYAHVDGLPVESSARQHLPVFDISQLRATQMFIVQPTRVARHAYIRLCSVSLSYHMTKAHADISETQQAFAAISAKQRL